MTVDDNSEQVELEGDARLLAELLRGVPVTAAAQAAGYSEATARRRLRAPEFRHRLDEGRRELTSTLAAQLAGACELAYAVLRTVALDTAVTPGTRVKAAVELLGLADRVGERVDLTAEVLSRLEALERAAGPRRVAA